VLLQHEIGHALGMVPPNGHAHFYSNKPPGYGGSGDHCAFNAGNKTNAEALVYGVAGDGESGSVKIPQVLIDAVGHAGEAPCVMYHTRSSVHHLSLFCDTCKDVLRGGSLVNKWSWSVD
jgi:hypothetical protein